MPRPHRLLAIVLLLPAVLLCMSHFQVLVPDRAIVTRDGGGAISLDIRFTHPMAGGPLMHMDTPRRFGVLHAGETTDLLSTLQAEQEDDCTRYSASYELKAPGDHVFFLEPAPYWEPAEGKMITHYTKVVVNGFGLEEGWDELVGLPVEIEPLVRPYGIWTGNCFRGIVRGPDGEPVPFAEIEVEYLNADDVEIPAGPFETQVIKADGAGVFSYALPRAGWWSFAALVDGPEITNPDGETVGHELGGLIWIRARDMTAAD